MDKVTLTMTKEQFEVVFEALAAYKRWYHNPRITMLIDSLNFTFTKE